MRLPAQFPGSVCLGVFVAVVFAGGSPAIAAAPNAASPEQSTYEAANGDLLFQTFEGWGQVDVVTLEVVFEGTELLAGGTGRVINAVGLAHTEGSASFVTNPGFLTTKGSLSY